VVLWGGVNGLLLFLAVLALIAGNSLIAALAGQARLGEILSFVVSFGALGSLVALLAGMVVGVFFALLDSALLALAGWLAPVRPDSL